MQRQKGYLLIVAVIIVSILALLSAALVHLFNSISFSSINTLAAHNAYALANAAVENGLYLSINNGLTCNNTYSTVNTSLSTGASNFSCTNYASTTTLNGAITSSATSITLTSTTGFSPAGYVLIDQEVITYTSISGNTLVGIARGQSGSSAASHTSGTAVIQYLILISGFGYSPSNTSVYGYRSIAQSALPGGYIAGDIHGYFYVYKNGWSQFNQLQNQSLTASTCASINSCQAGDNLGNIYVYNGSSWSQYLPSPATHRINGMACSSTSNCQAIDNNNNFFSYNGTTWSTNGFRSSHKVGVIANILTTNNYWAGGDTPNSSNSIFYYFNGSSWSSSTYNIANSNSIIAIACANANSCQAADSQDYFYIYNGTSWTKYSTPVLQNISAIAAVPYTNTYWATGQTSFYFYNGSSWSVNSFTASHNLMSIACHNPIDCQAGDSNGNFYAWNGSTWSLESFTANSSNSIYTMSAILQPQITLYPQN